MAYAADVRAGRAFVELGLNDSPFVRGLNSAKKRLEGWGAEMRQTGIKLTAWGASITGPIVAAWKSAVDWGFRVSKSAQRLGWTTQQLSELSYAAEISGASLSDLVRAVRYSQLFISRLHDPLSDASRVFKALKIDAGDFAKADNATKFFLLADAIGRVADASDRTRAAVKIFGRGGIMMQPLAQAGLLKTMMLRLRAQELGVSIAEPVGWAFEHAKEQLINFKAALLGLKITVATAVMPVMRWVVAGITNTIVAVRQWVAENEPLVRGLLKVGATLSAMGMVMIALSALAFLPALMAFAALGAAVLSTLASVGILSAELFKTIREIKIGGVVFGDIADVLKLGFEVAIGWVKNQLLDLWNWILQSARHTLAGIVRAVGVAYGAWVTRQELMAIPRKLSPVQELAARAGAIAKGAGVAALAGAVAQQIETAGVETPKAKETRKTAQRLLQEQFSEGTRRIIEGWTGGKAEEPALAAWMAKIREAFGIEVTEETPEALDISDALRGRLAKTAAVVAGTFVGAAAGRIAGPLTVERQILEAQEESVELEQQMVDRLEEVVEEMEDGGLIGPED